MPYEIEWKHRGAVKHFTGVVTFDDIISSEKAIAGNSNFMSLEYVLSIYLLAHRVIMDKTQRRDLRALRLGGYFSNPRIKYAFVTNDIAIKGPIEQSVTDGETLHPIRVFGEYEHAVAWVGLYPKILHLVPTSRPDMAKPVCLSGVFCDATTTIKADATGMSCRSSPSMPPHTRHCSDKAYRSWFAVTQWLVFYLMQCD